MMNFKAFSSGVPAGTIAVWYGTLGTVPNGWVVCDGNNGTPNLVGKTVMHPDDVNFSYGDSSLTHSHTHSGNTGLATDFLASGSQVAAGGDYSKTTQNHAHSVTASSASHMPPFYGLYFIMKT